VVCVVSLLLFAGQRPLCGAVLLLLLFTTCIVLCHLCAAVPLSIMCFYVLFAVMLAGQQPLCGALLLQLLFT
jgi:hypothetical protein